MAHRRLAEGATVSQQRRDPALAARRVVAIDEPAEGIEGEVLRERGPERERARRQARSPAQLVEGDPERGSVRRVQREARDRPRARPRHCLAQQRDVGVVAAKETPVERLQRRPREGGRCSGRRRAPSRPGLVSGHRGSAG